MLTSVYCFEYFPSFFLSFFFLYLRRRDFIEGELEVKEVLLLMVLLLLMQPLLLVFLSFFLLILSFNPLFLEGFKLNPPH